MGVVGVVELGCCLSGVSLINANGKLRPFCKEDGAFIKRCNLVIPLQTVLLGKQ